MSIPAWSWPLSGATARGVALVSVSGSIIAVPDWTTPTIWPFAIGASGAVPRAAIVAATGTPGFGSAVSDGGAGASVSFLTYVGNLSYFSGTTLSAPTVMPSGHVYVGLARNASIAYGMASDGTVWNSSGALVGTWPTSGVAMAFSGSASTPHMVSLLPASGVGTMTLAGVTGLIGFPSGLTTLSCLAALPVQPASGQPVMVGGWSTAAPLSGVTAAALDPQNTALMLAVGSGKALLWSSPGPFDDAWSQTQAVSGLANLISVCWRPDGSQALACDPVSGVVQRLDYTLGTLSLGQTLAVSGAYSVVVNGDSINAIVSQSGQSQAMPLTFAGSTWSVGTPVTGLTGIGALATYGVSGAVAAVSGGVYYLNFFGGLWSRTASASLGFSPTAVATDQFGQVYAVASGAVALVSGTTLVASGTWAGGMPTAVAIQQGRILIAVPSDGLLRVFGRSASGVLSQQTQTTMSLGTNVGLGLSLTTLFVMGSGATQTYGFSGAPYVLTPVLSGGVSLWNGASWTTTALGVGHLPSALGPDVSGNVWVATIQNTLWQLTSGGTVLSSGIITQYPGQLQSSPISPSAILATSSGVFIATSIPGALVQVA